MPPPPTTTPMPLHHNTPDYTPPIKIPPTPEEDGALGATQSIVSVLNNPAAYSYLKHLGIAKDAWMLVPPLLSAGVLPDVRMEDFTAFLESTGREQGRYEVARDSEMHAHKTAALLSPGRRGGGRSSTTRVHLNNTCTPRVHHKNIITKTTSSQRSTRQCRVRV